MVNFGARLGSQVLTLQSWVSLPFIQKPEQVTLANGWSGKAFWGIEPHVHREWCSAPRITGQSVDLSLQSEMGARLAARAGALLNLGLLQTLGEELGNVLKPRGVRRAEGD